MCNKMSDVRLTNASPVERVDLRAQENPRPAVRRNLFGAPDRAEVRRYAAESIAAETQAFAERYNFDAVNERPLAPGVFEWQEAGDAPEFYRRPPHRTREPQDPDPEGDAERQPTGDGSRKRPAPGSCSGESHHKRSHADEGDDDDDERGAGSQALPVEREAASGGAADSPEVQ